MSGQEGREEEVSPPLAMARRKGEMEAELIEETNRLRRKREL